MQVSVEKTGGLERRMKVQVPAERVENEIDTRLKSLGKRAKIKGFRPGKVPFKVVKQQYGPQVRQEVLEELLRSTYSEALAKEKLNPAGGPKIDPVSMEPGRGLEYTATFEIYPDIAPKGLDSLKVERQVAEITKADVDKMVENLRRQRGSWEPVERAAKDGDQVTIDFEGDLKGKPFPGNKGMKVPVVLGSGRMIEGFEAKLEGLGAGDETEFDIKFPKDYPCEDVAGKKAHFKVTVHQVAELKLPPLDDEFCKAFGVEEGGLDALRKDVRENMQREMEDTVRRRVKDQVLDGLLTANKLDLPHSLVNEEIERLKQDALSRMGVTDRKNRPELPNDLFEEQARRRVSLGLLLGEIIQSQKLRVDSARLNDALERLVEGYQQPEEMLRAYRANPGVMRQLESMVLEDQAVDFLLEKAQIIDKQITFSALMNFENK